MKRTCDIHLEYQPPIVSPPIPMNDLHQQTVSNDQKTLDFFQDIWLRNMAANKEIAGSFKENGIQKLYKKYQNLPVICIGSGPSLKHYAKHLRPFEENGIKYLGNPGILTISALHNFAYLTDLGVKIDYWMTLDGGEVVIDEMFDGATKFLDAEKKIIDKEFYRNASKNQKLLSYVGTNPRLWANWLGEKIWFQSVLPNADLREKMKKIEPFELYISSGGNVLGGSFYAAKAIFGCNPVIFMGADFSFSYDHKFHSFDSKYDTMGQVLNVRDIYGNKVKTWASYYNFKSWFDLKSMHVPGVYINCSDGCMGAYEQGNIMSIIQKHIEDVLESYRVSDRLKENIENLDTTENGIVLF